MANESSSTANMQGVPAASLRIGMQLPMDVYEDEKVLLLKRGSVVTERFLRNLKDRGLSELFIHTDDVKKLMPPAREAQGGGHVDLETESSRAADAAPFDDRPTEGLTLLERITPRKGKPYEKEILQELLENHDHDVKELSSQLTGLMDGSRDLPSKSIELVTTRYIWHMCRDMDATLSVAQIPHKEDYFTNHGLQMSVMGMALVARMGMPEDEVRVAGISALLHDIGMGRVPKEIVESPRPIEPMAWLEIMKHPIHTLDMTERILGVPNRCRLIVYQVHERHNGMGYPRKRPGAKIYSIAKALGIVDAYLAMINDRPYRNAMLPYHAMERILKEAKMGYWDPKVVRAFVSLVGLFPVGSYVMLSDESLGKVVRSGGDEFAKPQVIVTHNADGVPQKGDQLIDLAEEDADGLSIRKAIPPLFEVDELV